MASATMIELDGAAGEGGGQMLRSALTLSMLTGKALHMRNIRAGRAKSGLLRQHLTAVQAAAQISAARVDGAVPSSRELQFVPGPVRAGHYRFAIGTAGSCTLVLQTVLPALWFADGPSEVHVTGGTHNPLAPPVNFLQLAWVPLLTRMGAKLSIELIRHGFYPAGGGEVRAIIEPSAPVPIELDEPGAAVEATIIALVAGVPPHAARAFA